MAKTLKQQITEIDDKIAELQVKKVGLEAKLADIVDPDMVVAGANIEFEYGKGDGRRTLLGTVLGRKNAEAGAKGGDLVKVAVGEGFDAQIVTISPNVVTKIVAAEGTEVAVSETDALNGVA